MSTIEQFGEIVVDAISYLIWTGRARWTREWFMPQSTILPSAAIPAVVASSFSTDYNLSWPRSPPRPRFRSLTKAGLSTLLPPRKLCTRILKVCKFLKSKPPSKNQAGSEFQSSIAQNGNARRALSRLRWGRTFFLLPHSFRDSPLLVRESLF